MAPGAGGIGPPVLGPTEIGAHQNMPASTVHRVWTRAALHRLTHVDRVTGKPIRRYEHPNPGDLLHVDVKKLGNIPDGRGWRYVGRTQGNRHRAATPDKTRNAQGTRTPRACHRRAGSSSATLARSAIGSIRCPPTL